jgi:NADH:ubiquinone oxidoreductase subunit H
MKLNHKIYEQAKKKSEQVLKQTQEKVKEIFIKYKQFFNNKSLLLFISIFIIICLYYKTAEIFNIIIVKPLTGVFFFLDKSYFFLFSNFWCLNYELNSGFNIAGKVGTYLNSYFFLSCIFNPFKNIIIVSIFLIIIPVLLTVALLTLVERKTMAALQRRRGPNIIGFFGLLQPFADGLKLLTKEFNIPGRSFDSLVITTPMISLMFTCSCFSLVPLTTSFIYYTTNSLSALYIMAISSLNIYSIIMAGWSSKSAYAFLGSLRASAQFISYEVSMTLNIMGVFLVSGSFNLVEIAYVQEQTLPNIFVIFPIFLLYLIGVLSETNRTPYDLAEAESELVAGYGVEFSAVGFAFFFIAEYASIILYCLLILNLFFGGLETLFLNFVAYIFKNNVVDYMHSKLFSYNECEFCEALIGNLCELFDEKGSLFFFCDKENYKEVHIFIKTDEEENCILDSRGKAIVDYVYFYNCYGYSEVFFKYFENITVFINAFLNIVKCFFFGLKVFILLNFFIHIRATYARYRFDQLMKLNWKNLLILSLVFDFYVAIILLMNF